MYHLIYLAKRLRSAQIEIGVPLLIFSLLTASILTLGNLSLIIYAQVNTTFENNLIKQYDQCVRVSITARPIFQQMFLVLNSIPTAQSVFDSGTMTLPPSVGGVIIFIPDEAASSTDRSKDYKPKKS